MYRILLALLVAAVVLTVLVKLLKANWRDVGTRTRQAGADLATQGKDLATRGKDRSAELAARGLDRSAELADHAREQAAALQQQTQALRDKAADVAGGLAGRHGDQLARHLERTLLVPAAVTRVAPVAAAGMRRAALFDAVDPDPGAGEAAAWHYQAMGTVRLVVAADPRDPDRSAVGVTSYEVVMGDPQGAQATEHALDEVLAELTAQGLTAQPVQRAFVGAEDADGTRRAAPLT